MVASRSLAVSAAQTAKRRNGKVSHIPIRSRLEALVTHPDAFALTTATPLQRAICRCLDGVALGELAFDPDVQWAFSSTTGDEALAIIAKLPVGELPAEVVLCAAVRCAKTLISSALAFKACLTVDLSLTRPNEEVRYSIAATDIDKARMAISHLEGTIPYAPLLRPFFLHKITGGLMIRHPSGRPIEIKVIVAGRGGAGVISRWSAGLTADEAARMQGQGKVVNLPDLLKAAHGRILPGGQIFMPGSPWAPTGPIFDAVQDQWGKPSSGRVVIRGRGPMMHPALWTPAYRKKLLGLPNGELIVQTECDAEFGSPETYFFTSENIRHAIDAWRDRFGGGPDAAGVAMPLSMKVPYNPDWDYAAWMDPATRGNAWTAVIVGRKSGETEAENEYVVAYACEWRGTKSNPMRGKKVFEELAPVLEEYGLTSITSDGWSVDLIAEVAADASPPILVELDDGNQETKDKRYIDFREAVISEPPRIAIPPIPQLRGDLLAIQRVLTPNGMRFPLPTTGDGRHADYAPSTVGAFAKAKDGPSWISAMRKVKGRQDAEGGPKPWEKAPNIRM